MLISFKCRHKKILTRFQSKNDTNGTQKTPRGTAKIMILLTERLKITINGKRYHNSKLSQNTHVSKYYIQKEPLLSESIKKGK